jgi:alkanesulfonate monooxygenase SsuD/methylene tetrahydromethanopterin reductase-like flavin-dependent oxidoreductase (luciferase family)
MFISYFTEQPMYLYPEAEAERRYPGDHPARRLGDVNLLFSNRFFDAEVASQLYRERLTEYQLAEEVGFDGIMTNEHHDRVDCMQARCNIMSAFVAGQTSRIKIVQLGNPLPLWDNPVQLAEETAMIDLLSGGRLVTGIVRGGGIEQIANNVNPAHNRERFAEAHDLLIKTWTEPGPFRWEGDHYQVRVVNPWVLPLQKPHPRVIMPGTASPDTVTFAAEHGYPFVCMNTTLEQTTRIWQIYDQAAEQAGFIASPDSRGYLMRATVAATEEKALKNAEEFLWLRGGKKGKENPLWLAPAGYTNRQETAKRMGYAGLMASSVSDQIRERTLIAGTPDQVVEQMRFWLERTRPSMLFLWANAGRMNHADSMECIRLMGEEVLPRVRQIGAELGLQSPFETNAPVSVKFRKPQVLAGSA